ncbi:1-phosphofructokinase family hexose kinase [Parafilimonas sp.]|uniref:1-phosphofructokinase family hexose kinase n=1 Tax=Parafilimonas sp. TaxID=1969739 RepID=UPI0039E61D78
MIATITINPALDKSASVEKIMPEKKLRCSPVSIEAGGGGINVSKAIQKLGGKSLAVFPVGGTNGEVLRKLLDKEGIVYKNLPVASETREAITIQETSSNAQYRFVMPGQGLTETDIENFLRLIQSLNPFPDIMVASGSLQPGVPDNFFASLSKLAKQKDIKFFADTSGEPLRLAVQEGVYLLKPNLSELCSLAGKSYLELSEVDEAAKHLISSGRCEVIVVSMGPAGAMLVTKDRLEKIAAPTVKKRTTVGTGDSMVAGMAWMLEQGKSLSEMVRFGVACGTAATMNAGTQLFKKEDVYKLYDWINRNSEK